MVNASTTGSGVKVGVKVGVEVGTVGAGTATQATASSITMVKFANRIVSDDERKGIFCHLQNLVVWYGYFEQL